jgi:DNA-binding response OmpR family regulator
MIGTVMLVEDETKTAEMLKQALESEDIEVLWVQDGKTALQEMKKSRFDLIILDLKLPEMSGDEILECIRKIDTYVTVIVYSNYGDNPSVLQKLINLGVEGFIRKGADADLWGTVKKVKSLLDPFSEDEKADLLSSLPEGAFVNPHKDDE